MLRFVLRLFQLNSEAPKILGRWGYHWESKILHQKYYD